MYLFIYLKLNNTLMKYIFVLMLALVVQFGNSQEKLTFVKGGKVLNEAGYKINSEVVKLILKDNPTALDLYTTGRDKKTTGNILLISGFALATGSFVYHLNAPSKTTTTYNGNGNYPTITTERIKPTVYYVSAAMILIAIPIKIGFSKRIKKAIEMNNSSLPTTSNFKIDDSYFLVNNNGVGVGISF